MSERKIEVVVDGNGTGATRMFKQVGSEASGFGSHLTKLAAVAGAALGAVGVAGVLKDMVAEAREAVKVGNLTNAVLKSTASAAHITVAGVDELANSLSVKAGIDDELIQSGENVLLTFTNIRNEVGKGNDIFNQATGAALDMSVALGQDMQSSVVQLGKALNDPIKGITALQRVGVAFTKQQKDQIAGLVKHGQTLKAQQIILHELGTEFGGAAAAAASPMDKLKVIISNLEETVGLKLLPVIDRGITWLGAKLPVALDYVTAKFNEWKPTVVAVATTVADRVVPVVKDLIAVFQDVAGFIGDHLTVTMIAVGAVIGGVLVAAFVAWAAAALAAAAAQVAALAPVAALAIAVGALVAGVIYAYQHFQTFRAVVDSVVSGVVGAWQKVAAFTKQIWPQVEEAVGHVVHAVRDVVSVAVNAVVAIWRVAGDDILKFVSIAWSTVRGVIDAAMKVIEGVIRTVLAVINGDWGKAWAGIKQILAGVWDGIKAVVSGGLQAVGALITGFVSVLLTAGRNVGKAILDGIHDGLNAGFGALKNTWNAMVSHLPGFLKDKLEIRSPSKVMFRLGQFVVQGVIDGVKAKKDGVLAAMKDVYGTIMSGVGDVQGALGAVSGRAGAQRAVSDAQKALDQAVADRASLPAKIAEVRAKLTAAQSGAGQVTPAELLAIQDAEDAVTEAQAKQAELQKSLIAGGLSAEDETAARRELAKQISRVAIAQDELTKTRRDATAVTSEVTDLESDLKDLLDQQKEAATKVTDAQEALTAAKLAAVAAEAAYVDAQQKLIGLAPGVLQFFVDLAKQAGLSNTEISTLVGTLNGIKGGGSSSTVLPPNLAQQVNVAGATKVRGPDGSIHTAAEMANLFGIKPGAGGLYNVPIGSLTGLPHFDRGGVVPGPIGWPQLVVAHGGEAVLTPGQQSAWAYGGRGPSTGSSTTTLRVEGIRKDDLYDGRTIIRVLREVARQDGPIKLDIAP